MTAHDLSFVAGYKDIRRRLMGTQRVVVPRNPQPARLVYSCPVGPRKPAVLSKAASKISALSEVALKHGVSEDEIVGAKRNAKIIAARHEFWWVCVRVIGWSYHKTSKILSRDHTTIKHGVLKHEATL